MVFAGFHHNLMSSAITHCRGGSTKFSCMQTQKSLMKYANPFFFFFSVEVLLTVPDAKYTYIPYVSTRSALYNFPHLHKHFFLCKRFLHSHTVIIQWVNPRATWG